MTPKRASRPADILLTIGEVTALSGVPHVDVAAMASPFTARTRRPHVTKIVLGMFAVLGLITAVAAAPTPASSVEGRFYGSAEYLLWWTKDAPNQVPLVTKGFVGSPGTEVLIGGKDVDFGSQNGARAT